MMATKRGLAATLGARTPLQWLALVLICLVIWAGAGVLVVLSISNRGSSAWSLYGLIWLAATWGLVELLASRLPGRGLKKQRAAASGMFMANPAAFRQAVEQAETHGDTAGRPK